jgi:hypothetical protein
LLVSAPAFGRWQSPTDVVATTVPSRTWVPWRALSTPERWVCGYFTVLPLLWMAGLNLPGALAVTFGTLVFFVRSRRSLLLALPWLLVALAQTAAILANMIDQQQPLTMLAKHALSSYMLGWYVLWAALCVGASGILSARAFVRAVARIAFAYVILAVPAYLIALTSRAPFLVILSPVGHLLPAHSPATVFSFSMFVYVWEDFFGVLLPRLSLFFPWSTAAGYAGIFLVFIMLSEANVRRRRVGIAAAVFMIIASMSRLAWAAFVVCVAFRWFLQLPGRVQVILAAVVLATSGAAVIGGASTPRAPAHLRRARRCTWRRGAAFASRPGWATAGRASRR